MIKRALFHLRPQLQYYCWPITKYICRCPQRSYGYLAWETMQYLNQNSTWEQESYTDSSSIGSCIDTFVQAQYVLYGALTRLRVLGQQKLAVLRYICPVLQDSMAPAVTCITCETEFHTRSEELKMPWNFWKPQACLLNLSNCLIKILLSGFWDVQMNHSQWRSNTVVILL